MEEVKTINRDNILYIILGVLSVFLMISKYIMLNVACVFAILCLLIVFSKDKKWYFNGITYSFLAVLFLNGVTGIVGILFPEFSAYTSLSALFEEVARCIIYIALAQILIYLKVNVKVYAWFWKTILFVTVFIVVCQYFQWFDMTEKLRDFYGDSKQFYNAQFSDLSKFRAGSVFVNPNVFACFLVGFTGMYLSILPELNENPVVKVIVTLVTMLGFVLCGSRTGFLLAVILYLIYLFKMSGNSFSVFFGKVMFALFFIVLALLLVPLVFEIDINEFFSSRLFQVFDGFGDSFAAKSVFFSGLITRANPFNIFFGFGPYDYGVHSAMMVDFDFGYFFGYFGVLGVLVYLLLITCIFKHEKSKKQSRKDLNFMFAAIFILFGFTAGIFFNLRIFCIYLLMFLPMLYKKEERVA